MSDNPLLVIKIKYWKKEEGSDEIQTREDDLNKRYSNLDNDMNLIGEYSFDNKQVNGTFGRKTEVWNINKNKPINIDTIAYSKFKIFDSENKWVGTIEEKLIDEIVQSYKSDPRLIFSLSLSNNNIFNLTQRPNFYIFPFILDKKSSDVEFFILEKKTISMGSDWIIKRCILGDSKVADIDSKRGRKINISIYDEIIAKNDSFLNYILLFAITIRFHKEIKDRLIEYTKAIKESTLILHVSDKVLEQYSVAKNVRMKRSTISKQEKHTKKEKSKSQIQKKEISDKDIKESIRSDIKEKSKKEVSVESQEVDKDKTSQEKVKSNKEIKELSFKAEDPIEEAEGIGKKTGARFREIGIATIGDFINADIDEIYKNLPVTWITKSKLKKWQQICINHIL